MVLQDTPTGTQQTSRRAQTLPQPYSPQPVLNYPTSSFCCQLPQSVKPTSGLPGGRRAWAVLPGKCGVVLIQTSHITWAVGVTLPRSPDSQPRGLVWNIPVGVRCHPHTLPQKRL